MGPIAAPTSHPTASRDRRRRRSTRFGPGLGRPAVVALVTLVVALVGTLSACGYDGPVEEDFLPAVHLVHPDAVEVGRRFTRDERIDTIDGANRYHPATTTVELRFTSPTTEEQLWSWYEARLGEQGWSPADGATDAELRMQTESAGMHHRYAVDHRGDTYRITYEIRDPAFDVDCFAR